MTMPVNRGFIVFFLLFPAKLWGFGITNRYCPAGKMAFGSAPCKDCPKGRFKQSEGYGRCYLCDKFDFTPYRGQRKCTSCPRGQFSYGLITNDYTDTSSGTKCTSCLGGTETKSSRRLVVYVRSGQYIDSRTYEYYQCQDCEAGKYQPNIGGYGMKCKHCPAGKFTFSKGSEKCKFCQEGKVNDYATNGLHNIQGCIDCPQGQYNDLYNLRREATCKICRRTSFFSSTSTGNDKCDPCNKGNWIQLSRSIVCCNCENHDALIGQGGVSFIPKRETVDSTGCTGSDCLKHYYPTVSEQGRCLCKFCPVGQEPYADERNEFNDASVRCVKCQLGKVRNTLSVDTAYRAQAEKLQIFSETDAQLVQITTYLFLNSI